VGNSDDGGSVSAAAKRHLSRVAGLGCILCAHHGDHGTPAEIHHPKEWTGAGQRASDWLAVPLCTFHHRGVGGLHGLGTKGFYARYKLAEHDLLAMTIEALNP
jgi:hypothetical protein